MFLGHNATTGTLLAQTACLSTPLTSRVKAQPFSRYRATQDQQHLAAFRQQMLADPA